jgi:hypothetical protein
LSGTPRTDDEVSRRGGRVLRWGNRVTIAVGVLGLLIAGRLLAFAVMAFVATAGVMHPIDVSFEPREETPNATPATAASPADLNGREPLWYAVERDGFRYAEPVARVLTARAPVPDGDRAELSAGWPWHEASASVTGRMTGATAVEGGIGLDRSWLPWTGRGPPEQAVVPLRPMVGGLLANTLVFAGLVGVVGWAAWAIDRLPRITKRHSLALLLVSLGGGVLLTVTVARWCAWSLDPYTHLDLPRSDWFGTRTAMHVGAGTIMVEERSGVARAWSGSRWTPAAGSTGGDDLPFGFDREALGNESQRVEDLAGWPFYAMRTVRMFDGDRLDDEGPGPRAEMQVVEGAVAETADAAMLRVGRGRIGAIRPLAARLVPGGILWPGFLLDVGLFATAISIVLTLAAWRPMRRTARLRRGCCGACGHSLAGALRCSECGASVEVQSARGAQADPPKDPSREPRRRVG